MKTPEKLTSKILWSSTGLFLSIFLLLGISACQQEDELILSASDSAIRQTAPEFQSDADEKVLYAINYDYTAAFPSLSNAATVTDQQIAEPNRPDVFNVIRIDHNAGRSTLPDYCVTVRSDGLVIYEGRNHVYIKDRITFRLSGITINVLNEIFREHRFYRIFSDVNAYADKPHVLTTFRPTDLIRPHTIADDYYRIPDELIAIRKEVENLLGIHKYVFNNFPIGPRAVVTPTSY